MSWRQAVPIPTMFWNNPETRTWCQHICSDQIVKTVTTTYSAEATDASILCDATSAAFTLTLPDATKCKGAELKLKKIDSSGNAITVDGLDAQTIDGAANVSLAVQWNSVIVQSDGANWVRWAVIS